MSKTATTWQLMKDSWRVLMRDKSLLLFPITSAVASFLVLLTFVAPFVGANVLGVHRAAQGEDDVVTYVVLFAFYLCNFFVVVFFNAALVDFVVTRLRGGAPTLRGSLRAAAACLPQIAAWSLIAATVGVLLKALSERAGLVGKIAISVVGFAWALVTYFVVPIIVVERKGAMEAVAASKDLLARTWGKQVASGLGYGLIGFVLMLPGLIAVFAAIFEAVTRGHIENVVVLGAVGVLYLVAVGVVMSALRAIFGAVLYLFARTGQAPEGFSATHLTAAMQPTG